LEKEDSEKREFDGGLTVQQKNDLEIMKKMNAMDEEERMEAESVIAG